MFNLAAIIGNFLITGGFLSPVTPLVLYCVHETETVMNRLRFSRKTKNW